MSTYHYLDFWKCIYIRPWFYWEFYRLALEGIFLRFRSLNYKSHDLRSLVLRFLYWASKILCCRHRSCHIDNVGPRLLKVSYLKVLFIGLESLSKVPSLERTPFAKLGVWCLLDERCSLLLKGRMPWGRYSSQRALVRYIIIIVYCI